jgi:hypothetical protein
MAVADLCVHETARRGDVAEPEALGVAADHVAHALGVGDVGYEHWRRCKNDGEGAMVPSRR